MSVLEIAGWWKHRWISVSQRRCAEIEATVCQHKLWFAKASLPSRCCGSCAGGLCWWRWHWHEVGPLQVTLKMKWKLNSIQARMTLMWKLEPAQVITVKHANLCSLSCMSRKFSAWHIMLSLHSQCIDDYGHHRNLINTTSYPPIGCT